MSTTCIGHLTIQEISFLLLLAECKCSAKISDELNISVNTVRTRKTRLIQKLNLQSAMELNGFAVKNKDELNKFHTSLIELNSKIINI